MSRNFSHIAISSLFTTFLCDGEGENAMDLRPEFETSPIYLSQWLNGPVCNLHLKFTD